MPGMSCGIIAHEAKKLPEYFDIIKRAYENLPEHLKPKTKTDTKNRLDFTHRFDGAILDSSIYVAVKLRGGTTQNLHITESAYIKDRQELVAGSKQAVPVNGRISEETTGNGFEDFYDTYMYYHQKQPIGEQDYKTYFYPWVLDPDYTLPGQIDKYTDIELKILQTAKELYNITVTDGQLLWRRWKKEELRKEKAGGGIGLNGDQLFKQEYPLTISEAFQSGAGSVFDGDMVENIPGIMPPMSKLEMDTRYKWNYNRLILQERMDLDALLQKAYAFWQQGVMFWHLPEAGQRYVIGCDPADGQGSDNTAIDVWDADTLEQVAQFYGKIRPDEAADLLAALGWYYNHAFIGVENNMLTTVLFLSKIYDFYYFTNVVDEKTQKKTKKIGWSTNGKTRNLMIDDYIIDFEDGTLEIHSAVTQGEMKTFVKKDNGKREHANGKHDDALFAAFVAMQMIRFYPKVARVFGKKPNGL